MRMVELFRKPYNELWKFFNVSYGTVIELFEAEMKIKRLKKIAIVFVLLLLISWACVFPNFGGAPEDNNTEVTEVRATNEPLPAAIVEVAPIPGTRLALDGGLTFFFNQGMDRDSVEAAINGEPSISGSFDWENDRTVTFIPANSWLPDTEIKFIVSENAKADNGLSMQGAAHFSFKSSNYLKAIQQLPEPDVINASPSSSVLVSFNQAVVALGADAGNLPVAFTLDPSVEGQGEWLNTNTYKFTPDLSLEGGVSYEVQLNPNLKSLGGSPLTEELEDWTFSTDVPRVIWNSLDDFPFTTPLEINSLIRFNTPMNADQIEEAFLIEGPSGEKVEGEFEWLENQSLLSFTPNSILKRNTKYSLTIDNFYEGSFLTSPELSIVDRNPGATEFGDPNNAFSITFSSDLKNTVDYSDYITIDPMLDGLVVYAENDYQWNLYNKIRLNAYFQANTKYTVTISENLADKWGDKLGQETSLEFYTGSYKSSFNKYFYYRGMWADPSLPVMAAQAVNISSVDMMVGNLPFEKLLSFESTYWSDDGYRPVNLNSWSHPITITSDLAENIAIPLTEYGTELVPGIYWLMASSPNLDNTYLSPSFVVASHINLVFKQSAYDVSIWAIDRRDQTPVSGQPVKVYDLEGNIIVQGITDSEGLFYSKIGTNSDSRSYQTIAMMNEPGDEFFSLVSSDWAPYYSEFGNYYGQDPETKTYVYTDRPIYRPGDTVYFRAILRETEDGNYFIPDLSSISVNLNFDYSKTVDESEIQLSGFGTATGSFYLPPDSPLGYYWIEVNKANCEKDCSLGGVNVNVLSYVKPSVDLQVDILNENAMPGDDLIAETSVEFYFGQVATGVNLEYRWYSYSGYFNIPGYSVGTIDREFSFYNPYASSYKIHESGEVKVDDEGKLQLRLEAEPNKKLRHYYFSVNLNEKGEQLLGAEESILVHPSEYYIGIKADSRVGKVDEEMGFELKVVDWDLQPFELKNLTTRFYEVSWEPVYSQYGFQGSNPVYTEILTNVIAINKDGLSNFTFVPPKPGVYMVEAGDDETFSQTMVWVNGLGSVSWKDVLYNRIELEKDKETYQPGETAQIFIPNTFEGPAQALISIERENIYSQEIIDIENGGLIYELFLDEKFSPNVYLSVSMIGKNQQGILSLTQGKVNIPVDPQEHKLNLEIIGEPDRLGPGDEVAISIRVTDTDGNPVEAEFSVSVVDKAIYALADPAEENILNAFYDQIRHAVKTSGSLLVSTETEDEINSNDGGMGGGGGDGLSSLRSNFKDTAYWTGQIVTNSKGEAELVALMPDNLSTWKILVRGISEDTKVGEAEIEILTTKELIVRPITPQFLVAGDHLEIGSYIHNNSDVDLQVGVAIQVVGFTLDEPNTALQDLYIPAGERVWAGWWGTVEAVDAVSLIFAASGGGLSDITTPSNGDIPVLKYLAKQTFSTSGLIENVGESLEVISLPASIDPTEGSLIVSLASSLAGAILPGLEVLEANSYENIESTVSRFLPNLETYRAVHQFGLKVPELESSLDRNLEDALFKLAASQNYDGGWGWTSGRESNPMVSAYALLGWARANQIGMDVNNESYQLAADYLLTYLLENINDFTSTAEYDRSAFIFYVLRLTKLIEKENKFTLEIILDRIYENRDLLNPWGQAFFTMALKEANPDDLHLPELYSNLKSSAIRSSTGAHWEEKFPSYGNMSSTLINTSAVLYALANEDPSSVLVADTVRYLMAHRDVHGAWTSNYATSWSILSLVEVMKGTGELGGEFDFSASFNSKTIAVGKASGTNQVNLISATVGIEEMFADDPNDLRIQRDAGIGRLYYSAVLQLSQPVEAIDSLDRDLHIERTYSNPEDDCSQKNCESLDNGKLQDFIEVRLSLTVPHDLYYVVVEDFIPAGAEIINKNLNIFNYYYNVEESYDPFDPFADGWGWWYFDNPKIYEDHIYWMVDYLPAGNYQLSYTIGLMIPGEFQVIPAHAEQLYFPEVQANSAGEKFEILP